MTDRTSEGPRSNRRRGNRATESIGLLYFAPRDVLIPRVDRQCIMRFCEALAARGVDVEVVSLNVGLDYDEPTRTRDLPDVYGLGTRFATTILPSRLRQSGSEHVSPLWRLAAYSAYAAWKLLVTRKAVGRDYIILYFKNYILGLPFFVLRRLLGRRIILLLEIHVPPIRKLDRFVLRHVDGVVTVSRILARELSETLGIDPARVTVAHQGVNLEAVEQARVDKEAARTLLDLPLGPRLAIYTGKVHSGSGEIDLLLRSAATLPDGIEMVIVGGRKDHVQSLRERIRLEGIKNVRFTGFVAPAEIFRYQMAADVLVTYYPSNIPLNKYRASPGKLFEYMASRRPIVTADYPALREALTPDAAIFVEKDDPHELARGIMRVLEDDALAARVADAAYREVQKFTWAGRADHVVAFAGSVRAMQLRRRPLADSGNVVHR